MMDRRGFLGLLAGSAATPAFAARPSHALGIILRSPPGWVLKGAALDLDFVNGRAFMPGGWRDPSTLLNISTPAGYSLDSAGNLVAFTANSLRRTDRGLLIEEARTNVVLWNRDLTNAAWIKSNITAAKDQTGVDGVENAASSLTATAGNGTCLQAITLASSARLQSAFVKRITGSGTVNMTTDNGSTWTAVTVTAAWTRVKIAVQTLANPTVGFRLVTSGDAIAVDFVQNEAGGFATSPILVTTVAVARAADVVTASAQALTAFGVVGSVAVFCGDLLPFATRGADVEMLSYGASINCFVGTGGTGQTKILTYEGTTVLATGNNFAANSKIATGWNASGRSLVLDNGTLVTDSVVNGAMASVTFGNSGSGARPIDACLKRVAVWKTRLSNANLNALTV